MKKTKINTLLISAMFFSNPVMGDGDQQQDSYIVRPILINSKKPEELDLHGVASAAVAKKKVNEFINAAKAKRKEEVAIITGKGSHSTKKKQMNRQTLLDLLPGWVALNPNVEGLLLGKGGGCYTIFLTPPLKEQHLSFQNQTYANQLNQLEIELERQKI